ncbi:MAG: gamma-glutamyl-gamma-aminobutyrate hydrolase family protein [Succinivibrio sp.]
MKKRPVIGVLPLYDTALNSIWMLPGYMNGLMENGASPVILPYTDNKDLLLQTAKLCDGFLFTGGQDVNPALYHQKQSPKCQEVLKELDALSLIIFNYAKSKNLPLLGICRGCQILNVFFGGTLYQDLASEHPEGISHSQKKPYSSFSHKVSLTKGSYLEKLLTKDLLEVNSIHHQAIKDVADDLSVEAVSEDGLVEAVKAKNYRYMLAVQWHPEYAYQNDINSNRIFKDFVKACEEF